ncbi:MAG: hypothetical protein ACUVTO_07140 [Candidatus Caldatribacteriaceae bacterium]
MYRIVLKISPSFILFDSFVTLALALEMGSAVPPFVVTTPDGETLSSFDILGKLSVVFYDTRHTQRKSSGVQRDYLCRLERCDAP